MPRAGIETARGAISLGLDAKETGSGDLQKKNPLTLTLPRRMGGGKENREGVIHVKSKQFPKAWSCEDDPSGKNLSVDFAHPAFVLRRVWSRVPTTRPNHYIGQFGQTDAAPIPRGAVRIDPLRTSPSKLVKKGTLVPIFSPDHVGAHFSVVPFVYCNHLVLFQDRFLNDFIGTHLETLPPIYRSRFAGLNPQQDDYDMGE